MKPSMLKIIKRHRMLRISILLLVIFLVILLGLLMVHRSFQSKLNENRLEFDIAKQKLSSLESLIEGFDETQEQSEVDKKLAPHDSIVPFIALLENVFELIDPEARVTIKDDESQILLNRYADYEVYIEIGDGKGLFFEAVNDLYNGTFLTEIKEVNLNYGRGEEFTMNELESAHLIVRLFFE